MECVWGSVPDWLAASATLLAVVFAGIAARTANNQLKILQREAREREADSLRRQARLVYFVKSQVTENARSPVEILFVNVSDEPLLDVHIVVAAPGRTMSFYYGPLMPTGVEGIRIDTLNAQVNKVIAEYGLRAFRLPGGSKGVLGPHQFRIHMFFQDAGGHRWHRADDLTLTAAESGAEERIQPLELEDGIELMPIGEDVNDWLK